MSWLQTYMWRIAAILVACVLANIVAMIVIKVLRRKRARDQRRQTAANQRCAQCGYDLSQTSIPRCPECGALLGFTKSAEDLGIANEVRWREGPAG